MHIGFAGTPDFAATILGALIEAGHSPLLVLTQPDRPAGRGKRPQPSPVKKLATANGIPVHTPATLRDDGIVKLLADRSLDALIVAAYGLIVPESVLALPRFGCINVHASLLPRWRGAAPIERAIIAGDTETGISIMQMDAGLDTGDVLLSERVPILPDTTGAALEATLADLGAVLLLKALGQLGELNREPQTGEPTYAHKLGPADSACNWSESAVDLERQVRALAHRAPLWSALADVRVRILDADALADSAEEPPGTVVHTGKNGIQVACGVGRLALRSVQLSRGKGKPLTAADLVNGYPDLFHIGASFDATPR